MTGIQIAHAKLTVHLYVTGVRDDGMHLLDAEMVSLDLADTLEFNDGDGLEITGVTGRAVPDDDTNLVRRALRLAGRQAQVRLTKCIPVGGGLGGGSSDAAATLRWAGFDDPLQAATIGGDVPFCLRGGRARVRGVGEQIEPLPAEQRAYTLLLPPFGVDTADVYRSYDEMNARPDLSLRNHLEPAALAVEPRLGLWRDRFHEWTGQRPVLAGSGSTWFVEGDFSSPAPDELDGARWVVAKTVEPHSGD